MFSMTMFNWQADKGQKVISNRLWVYFVIAVPLTLIVMVCWIIWFRMTQKKYARQGAHDSEAMGSSDEDGLDEK